MVVSSRLEDLPAPGDRRLAVRVTPDALRRIRAGHPWIFDGAIRSVGHEADPGDLAVVFDDNRRFAAIGLYDPASPIRIRVLHAGGPRQVDEDFWIERLVTAIDRRAALAADDETTGYRCIHGENDGFPGLVVDRYANTLVLKIYTAAWLPHLRSIVPSLLELLAADAVVLRRGRLVEPGGDRASVLAGHLPNPSVEFLERGLRFEADVVAGQKTGHFLDQRENRVLVSGVSAGADVLDVFCCTGGFTVHAAAGGARSVLSVDRSGPALEMTRRNLAHNRRRAAVTTCRHDTVEGDAFDMLHDLARDGRHFDIVVIDPPSFASRASQVERAVGAYARLTALGLDVLRPGGMLVQSSCSSRVDETTFYESIRAAAESSGHRLEEWARTGHPVDHPVGFPEGRYLKTLFARADGERAEPAAQLPSADRCM